MNLNFCSNIRRWCVGTRETIVEYFRKNGNPYWICKKSIGNMWEARPMSRIGLEKHCGTERKKTFRSIMRIQGTGALSISNKLVIKWQVWRRKLLTPSIPCRWQKAMGPTQPLRIVAFTTRYGTIKATLIKNTRTSRQKLDSHGRQAEPREKVWEWVSLPSADVLSFQFLLRANSKTVRTSQKVPSK